MIEEPLDKLWLNMEFMGIESKVKEAEMERMKQK